MKLTVYYAPGPSMSDFVLEEMYRGLLVDLQKHDMTFTCSTENLFTRIRVGVFEGDIPHGDVCFRWRGLEFFPDSDGRLDYWPDGFLDVTEKLLERLLP